MQMNDAAFDTIAADYDTSFTHSWIGREQRRITRQLLEQFLSTKKKLKILDINCGTGEDALWLAGLEHDVIGIDISAEMIKEANRKQPGSANPKFLRCGFTELKNYFHQDQFDLVLSNFAGLNCASPGEITNVSSQINQILKPGGHFAVVVFGKNNLWETIYFLLKGKLTTAFRRWSNKKTRARLSQAIYQDIYYYSVGKIKKCFLPLKLVEKKPVGLFIPPSYLEQAIMKRPRFFQRLKKMESRSQSLSFLSPFADHVYLLFKKQIE
jgi:ubiquinone/menaquinone biosynthesis C-methylase UbiE